MFVSNEVRINYIYFYFVFYKTLTCHLDTEKGGRKSADMRAKGHIHEASGHGRREVILLIDSLFPAGQVLCQQHERRLLEL